jgi:hypothetical protein
MIIKKIKNLKKKVLKNILMKYQILKVKKKKKLKREIKGKVKKEKIKNIIKNSFYKLNYLKYKFEF